MTEISVEEGPLSMPLQMGVSALHDLSFRWEPDLQHARAIDAFFTMNNSVAWR
jgi:hypothetical protein